MSDYLVPPTKIESRRPRRVPARDAMISLERQSVLSDPTKFRRQVTKDEYEKAKASLRDLRGQRHRLRTLEDNAWALPILPLLGAVSDFVGHRVKQNRKILTAYHYQRAQRFEPLPS